MLANEMSNGGNTYTGNMLHRLNKAFFSLLYMLGNCPPQPLISLREQLYTEHFLKFLNGLIFYFIAYFIDSCVLFLIGIIPKSGLVLRMEASSVFDVVNCCRTAYSVMFQGCTHADAHKASDTDRSNAVNSPDSVFLASFMSEEQL